MIHVIVFKISDAYRRRKIRNVLRSYGWETIPGLFECPIGSLQANELRNRIERAAGEGDQIRMFRVCKGCRSGSWTHGGSALDDLPDHWYFPGDFLPQGNAEPGENP